MSKPLDLHLGDWNKMVDAFHSESDRGAAVLAGGFVEHILGSFLRAVATVPTAAEELFSPMGPLSNFSQRIAVAYAYGFIAKKDYEELTTIRRIRNHFAHHPVDTTFATDKIAAAAKTLSTFNTAGESGSTTRERNRYAYLFACAGFAILAAHEIKRRTENPSGVAPPSKKLS